MAKFRWLYGALTAAAIGAVALPAAAQIYIDVRPPAPRHEVIPVERAGYVWAPGYWDRRDGRWVWVKGRYIRERHGLYWHPSRWVERDGRWYLERGRWDRQRYAYRDRDRDGIPDRWERGMRDSDRDGVPNRVDRDRDNDGVPNRFDDRPNNPYRQ